MIEYDCHFTCNAVTTPFKWFWILTSGSEQPRLFNLIGMALNDTQHLLKSVLVQPRHTENSWFSVYSRCVNYIYLQYFTCYIYFGCHWWVCSSHFSAFKPLGFCGSNLFAQQSSNASFSTWLRQRNKSFHNLSPVFQVLQDNIYLFT